jgi:hypothetical protein
MTITDFNALIDALVAQGYDLKTACHYASLIGDTPEPTEDGKRWIVRENGEQIATVKKVG